MFSYLSYMVKETQPGPVIVSLDSYMNVKYMEIRQSCFNDNIVQFMTLFIFGRYERKMKHKHKVVSIVA